MSWITRCPDCDAVYKVESAQLQQAHGWLRCGTCQHVFDSTGRVVAADVIPTLTDRVNVGAPQLGRVDLERLLHKESLAPVATADTASAEPSPISAFEDALQSFKLPDMPAAPAPDPDEAALADSAPAGGTVASPAPARTSESVLRQTSRGWRLVVSLLLAAVAVQLLFAWRSVILSHWPQWGQMAAQWCGRAACRAQWQPPLSLWSLKAQPLLQEGSGYSLSWSLAHAAPVPLPMPALELIWLDAQGQVVSVQPLPSSVTAAPAALAAGQVWQGRLRVALAAPLNSRQAQLRLIPH